jgi:hypothetical protein
MSKKGKIILVLNMAPRQEGYIVTPLCFGGNSCNLLHTTRCYILEDSNINCIYMFKQVWISQSVWRRARRPGFDSQEVENCSFLRSIQTGSEANQSHIQWVPGVKRLGPEADHLLTSSAEVKSGGAIPSLPHMSSWYSAETTLLFVFMFKCFPEDSI